MTTQCENTNHKRYTANELLNSSTPTCNCQTFIQNIVNSPEIWSPVCMAKSSLKRKKSRQDLQQLTLQRERIKFSQVDILGNTCDFTGNDEVTQVPEFPLTCPVSTELINSDWVKTNNSIS